jgi:hypothetical protein
MKRLVVLSALGFALLALPGPQAAHAAAADPFGSLGGIPTGDNGGDGTIPLTGWALAQDGIFAVDIVVDGGIVGRATYGRSRPGVTRRFPTFPDSAAPGFAYELNSTHFLNGLHTISARLQSRTGLVTYTNERTIQFSNVTHNLIPFGKIDFPNANAELIGNCTTNPDGTVVTQGKPIFSVIDGWTLDPGAQAVANGIGYVELLVDRSLFANSHQDCHFSRPEGGLSDCFGLRRIDIEQEFPGLKDSPHAGFRFTLDVGGMLAASDSVGTPLWVPGSHEIGVRVGDIFNQVTDIDEIPVMFACINDINQDSIGHIDFPLTGLLYSGTILVTGWAVDLEGVQFVNVLIDGNQVGSAITNIPRPDITSFYPSYPKNPAPGFLFSLDTTTLSNGVHQLAVVVIDNLGADTFIGKFPITVANVIP